MQPARPGPHPRERKRAFQPPRSMRDRQRQSAADATDPTDGIGAWVEAVRVRLEVQETIAVIRSGRAVKQTGR